MKNKNRNLKKQEEKNHQQELKIEKQDYTLEKLEQKFEQLLLEKSKQNEADVVIDNFILKRTFAMENFIKEKAKDEIYDWKSPAMYTHVCGYKFCIGIAANGRAGGCGKALRVDIWAMPGEYDHQLKWPAQATFTIELLHQQGGQNMQHTITREWSKPGKPYMYIGVFGNFKYGICTHFIEHSSLSNFLRNDTLYFHLTKITI